MKSVLALVCLVCLAGAAHAAVPAVQTISAERLIDAARAVLPAPVPGTQVVARVVGQPGGVVVPAGSVELKAHAPQGRWPRARVAVPVSIRLRGAVVRTDTVWFAIQTVRNAWVYSKNEPAGTPMARLNPRAEAVDVAAAGGPVVASPEALAQQRLVRGVRAGWPLLKSDFEAIPAVDAQSRVMVHLQHGRIQLAAPAVALDAGNVGDTVLVKVNGAAAPVQAKVAAKGVVDVAY